MGRTTCTEPQCLYKGALYLYLYCVSSQKNEELGYMNCVFCDVGIAICVLSNLPAVFKSGVVSLAVTRRPLIAGKHVLS
jgi:hypothetical protein